MPQWTYFCAAFILLVIIFASGSLPENFLQNQHVNIENLWKKPAEIPLIRIATSFISLPDASSPWSYIKTLAILVGVYGYYILQIRPLNRVRKLGDVGYIPEGGYSIKETANLVQKCRQVGDLPAPYPNGWFALLESSCLKSGEVKPVTALGENFAVFRDENGFAHVVNAYCPHLGANLAVGGRVIGDCIECPFHAWRFRGEDGKCVHIPYSDRIPDIARIKPWPSREVSGWIFVWYHSEGSDPTWSIPVVEELESGAWIYRGRTEHFINAHIQEISENGADVNHLGQVHGPIITAGTDLRTIWNKRWAFASHRWTASWEQMTEPDGHVGCLKLTHEISVFGFLLPFLKLVVSARQLGPGLVYLEFNGIFGRGMFLLAATPQSPLLQRVVHSIYANSWMPAFMAKIHMVAEAIQVERDIMIWNNKRFEGRPLFVKSKEDTLLSKHRRWYSQFYTQKSSKFFQKDDLTF